MSEHPSVSQLVSAKAIDARAADWLERRDSEEWTEEDDVAFLAWLAESHLHMVSYLRLKAAWSRADRLVVLRQPSPVPGGEAPRLFSVVVRIAAVFVVAALLTTDLRLATAPQPKTYATALGEHSRIALADGSSIELNTDTVITVSNTAIVRVVTLEKGEAFFEVKHDAKRPFVVMAAGHRITDVGTRFFVRRDPGRVEVGVTEGRVAFKALARTGALQLAAGKVVVATQNDVVVTTKSSTALTNELAWRTGMVVFNRTTLAEAAAELNRYNHERLVIADPAASRLLIGGKFRTNDVETFARVARDLLGVRVKDEAGEKFISR
jgi:transmembrane sensor